MMAKKKLTNRFQRVSGKNLTRTKAYAVDVRRLSSHVNYKANFILYRRTRTSCGGRRCGLQG